MIKVVSRVSGAKTLCLMYSVGTPGWPAGKPHRSVPFITHQMAQRSKYIYIFLNYQVTKENTNDSSKVCADGEAFLIMMSFSLLKGPESKVATSEPGVQTSVPLEGTKASRRHGWSQSRSGLAWLPRRQTICGIVHVFSSSLQMLWSQPQVLPPAIDDDFQSIFLGCCEVYNDPLDVADLPANPNCCSLSPYVPTNISLKTV